MFKKNWWVRQRIVLNEIWNTCVCSWLVAMGASTKMVLYINWNTNKAFMWEKLKGLSFWTFSVVAKLFIETQDDFTTCTMWGNKKRDVIIWIHEHISLPLMFTMHCSIFQYTLHIEKFFLFNSNNKKYCKMLKTEEKLAKNVLVSVRGWSRWREMNWWLNWRYVFFVLGILRWRHWLVPLYKSDEDTALCSLALRLVDSASFLSALWTRQKQDVFFFKS